MSFQSAPDHLILPTDSGTCTNMCKYLKPLLIVSVVIVSILIICRLLKKSNSDQPAKSQAPFPKHIPQFPVQQSHQQQANSVEPYQRQGNYAPYNSQTNGNQYNRPQAQAYKDFKDSYASAQQNMNQVQQLTDSDFDDKLTNKRAVVAFVMNGCGHCEHMLPAFMEAGSKSKIPFFIVERSAAPQHMQKYSIRGFPTIFLFENNTPVKTFEQARTVEKLLEFTQ